MEKRSKKDRSVCTEKEAKVEFAVWISLLVFFFLPLIGLCSRSFFWLLSVIKQVFFSVQCKGN